ncbi:MAG: transcription termination/antitermination protein NusA [Treponema sp.]|nr:transcription termination/antitermination protein NusA [Candidatus Treponema caballi]
MSSDMSEAIRQLIQEKGYSEDSVRSTIENAIKAAYKRKFGTSDNCVVQINDDMSDVSVYSRKVIVDGVYDPVTEIELEDAKQMSDECELGDEIDILIDPKTDFGRSDVQTGKQTAHQSLTEIQKDSLYAEYKDKVGEIIIGYYQREKNGTIYVDLGKVEGILPKKGQSDREVYHKNDRIKALITEVKKATNGLQIILSRTDPEFVRNILELEVPEIYDKTVEIHNIVREAGYRTKIAVSSHREDVDPVGACVGLKGVRIKAVISELEGEKIDILKYDPDPRVFIKNALSPAEVAGVVILDEEKRQALAVVQENQFSLAIGKQGLNVRLANRLTDWSIDVKTEEQYANSDEANESWETAQKLFSDEGDAEYDEISSIKELPGVDQRVAEVLAGNGIEGIEAFVEAEQNGALANIEGLSAEDIAAVSDIISNYVEFVDDEETAAEETPAEQSETAENAEEGEEYYECPECGARITLDMTTCPNCGVGLSFEEE